MRKFTKRDIDLYDPIHSRNGLPKLPGKRYKLDDVQEDLDDYLTELDDPDDRDMMRERPVPTIPDVGNMFDDLVRLKLKVGHEGSIGMTPLVDIRIPTLRKISCLAMRYGFDQLAAILTEHIKLRQARATKQRRKAA